MYASRARARQYILSMYHSARACTFFPYMIFGYAHSALFKHVCKCLTVNPTRASALSYCSDASLGVLGANAEFYRSFREGDVKGMAVVWGDDNDGTTVACAHPAMPLVAYIHAQAYIHTHARAHTHTHSLMITARLLHSPL